MQVLTVSQVASYLRELLDSDLGLADLWVTGEVSGPRTQPSGHTYFVLKDEAAQLRGVLFRGTQLRQHQMVDHLTHGAQVIVHGRLSFYEARGDLQIVVDFVQPEGVGLHHAQFERLRALLEEEGLFDVSRKRPLPALPPRVCVVSPPPPPRGRPGPGPGPGAGAAPPRRPARARGPPPAFLAPSAPLNALGDID